MGWLEANLARMGNASNISGRRADRAFQSKESKLDRISKALSQLGQMGFAEASEEAGRAFEADQAGLDRDLILGRDEAGREHDLAMFDKGYEDGAIAIGEETYEWNSPQEFELVQERIRAALEKEREGNEQWWRNYYGGKDGEDADDFLALYGSMISEMSATYEAQRTMYNSELEDATQAIETIFGMPQIRETFDANFHEALDNYVSRGVINEAEASIMRNLLADEWAFREKGEEQGVGDNQTYSEYYPLLGRGTAIETPTEDIMELYESPTADPKERLSVVDRYLNSGMFDMTRLSEEEGNWLTQEIQDMYSGDDPPKDAFLRIMNLLRAGVGGKSLSDTPPSAPIQSSAGTILQPALKGQNTFEF